MALSRFNLFQKYTHRSKFTCIRLTFIRNYSIPQNLIPNENSSTRTQWAKEENISFLEYMKNHGLEGSSSELSSMLKKSEPDIDTKRYFMRQSIIAEQLYLSADGKDASIQSAIESLIEKVKTEDINPSEELVVDWQKIQPNYEKDTLYYEQMLESLYSSSSLECTRFDEKLELGMKLFGNDVDKIQKILLPQFEKKSLMKLIDERSQPKVSSRRRGLPKEKVEAIKAALLNVLQSGEKIRFKDIARSFGCTYFSVHSQWEAIRKEKNLPLLKKGRPGLDQILAPEELESLDKRIIEYATSSTKSMRSLAMETGIPEGSIRNRWNYLRKKHNLKGNYPRLILRKMSPEELEKFDKRIIEYAMSSKKSLQLLAKETGFRTDTIRYRWGYLRKKHDLEFLSVQKMSPDEMEKFDKLIIKYDTSTSQTLQLLANKTGISIESINRRWDFLRKKLNLKTIKDRPSLRKLNPYELEKFHKLIIEYATSTTKSMQLLAEETGIPAKNIHRRWTLLRKTHNLKTVKPRPILQKMSPDEREKFDQRIIEYATSTTKSLQLLANETGICETTIVSRWALLRKKHDLKVVYSRRSLQKLSADEREKFDQRIIEYATSSTKSIQLLANETDISAKTIYNRWTVLRKKHNLKTVLYLPSLQKTSLEELERVDKRIIEYATSTTKSLPLLADETGISLSSIVKRWKLLREKHNLKAIKPATCFQKMSPDERERFDKRIIEYATSSIKTMQLLANETGISYTTIVKRWKLLRKKHNLKTVLAKKLPIR